jgi:DNA-directed RNA polymerase alpha subunit
LLDANFSPVLNVKYDIEKTRNGDISNLENLKIEVLTN